MGTIQRSNESEEDYSKRKNRVRRTYMSVGGAGSALVHYNPLINYKWSTQVVEDGLTYTKNSGTSKVNALSYGGQGVKFNGVDQSVTVPDIGATSMIYFLDGVQVYTETPFYILNTVGIWKDVYYFNRVLTAAEQTNHISQPNNFYQDALSDVSCVLNMPMCENDSNVKDMVSGTLYPIANYTATARADAQNLTYGSQQTNFYKDSFGVRSGLSPYAEFDGTAYMDTGWVPPGDSDWQIEGVIYINSSGINEAIGTTSYGNTLIRVRKKTDSSLQFNVGTYSITTPVQSVGNSHFTLRYTSSTKDILLTLNGIAFIVVNSPLFVTGSEVFELGRRESDVWSEPIRLFQVHTEPQDPLELYNNAVSKGLLI